MAVSLFIAGDVVPLNQQQEVLNHKWESIFGEMIPYISGCDFSIVNLEAPAVIDKTTPIKKSGPCLYTSEITLDVLSKTGFNVLTLANNHFFDQGQDGVINTLNISRKYGFKTIGGGITKTEARKPLFLESNGYLIAIVNACEHEFSIADEAHGGSNPLDLINMQEDIKYCKTKADFVIVILHGGIEHYHYPTPRMKRWYHHFVDLGADAVVNHHQHCVCGYEIYCGKPIFYGLGNFYFPSRNESKTPETWNSGYAIQLTLDTIVRFEMIPYYQDVNGIKIRDREDFSKEIELLNLPITNDYFLQQKLDEYIIDLEYDIKLSLSPSFFKSRILSGLARRRYLGKLYYGKQLYTIKNKLTCESHLEIVQRLFDFLKQ